MTLFEQYKELEVEAGELAAGRHYQELAANGEKAKELREQFTVQDWKELIAHSSGKAQYEYIKMFVMHFKTAVSSDGTQTVQDWIELIAHSSGKAQYEYIKMFVMHSETAVSSDGTQVAASELIPA